MSKYIDYGNRLYAVLDEDDEYYLIDERWHPSERSMPRLAEKEHRVGGTDEHPIYLGFSEAVYVLNCGINWATDECATKELAELYYAQRVAEGRRMGSDAPQYDEIRGVWCVHFHW